MLQIDPTIEALTFETLLERQWGLVLRCLQDGCGLEAAWGPLEILHRIRRERLSAPVTGFRGKLYCGNCGSRAVRISPRHNRVFSYMHHEGAAGRRRAFEAWLDSAAPANLPKTAAGA